MNREQIQAIVSRVNPGWLLLDDPPVESLSAPVVRVRRPDGSETALVVHADHTVEVTLVQPPALDDGALAIVEGRVDGHWLVGEDLRRWLETPAPLQTDE